MQVEKCKATLLRSENNCSRKALIDCDGYCKQHYKKYAESQDGNTFECCICFSDKNSKDNLGLKCGHLLCKDCLHKMVTVTCPVCRADIVGTNITKAETAALRERSAKYRSNYETENIITNAQEFQNEEYDEFEDEIFHEEAVDFILNLYYTGNLIMEPESISLVLIYNYPNITDNDVTYIIGSVCSAIFAEY